MKFDGRPANDLDVGIKRCGFNWYKEFGFGPMSSRKITKPL